MPLIDSINQFIFNWSTYFYGIPAWIIIFIVCTKWLNKKVVVGDLSYIIIASLLHPIWDLLIVMSIIVLPVAFLVLYILFCVDGIKDKKIF